MKAGGRVAVAGACIVTGILAVWAVQVRAPIEPATARVPSTLQMAAETRAAPGSVLWLLSIGVSHYRQSGLGLQFADADAQAIATALQAEAGGRLYRDVKTLVLTNDEVTRDTILGSMSRFLSQAGPDDVVVIFLAGHGVQDRATGSYYFLPAPANAQNLVTAGLRMSDFDEMVRVVRHNVRAVVMMLDTCHAGALQVAAPSLTIADDPSAALSVGEGFFLLAATKPGEDSKENRDLKHGAFTYALLEGLNGAADADGDGIISVSDLFGYVARRVPQLTKGEQHPYNKVEGTDLLFAATHKSAVALAPLQRGDIADPITPPRSVTPAVNTIGVMEFRDLRADPEHEWIGKALRVALNTELSKVRALRVYSPELIDRTAALRRSDQIATAQQLGIRKLLTGSFHVVGNTLRIDAEIVDSSTGVQEGSDSVQGNVSRLFRSAEAARAEHAAPPAGRSVIRRRTIDREENEHQRRCVSAVARSRRRRQAGTGDACDAARKVGVPVAPVTPQQCATMRSRNALGGTAWAAGTPDTTQSEVREVLEDYRHLLERKDLDKLAALYVRFTDRQREALRAYFDNAARAQRRDLRRYY